jgi:hypothetical protein
MHIYLEIKKYLENILTCNVIVPKHRGSTSRKISLDFECFNDAKFLAIVASLGAFSPLHEKFVINADKGRINA